MCTATQTSPTPTPTPFRLGPLTLLGPPSRPSNNDNNDIVMGSQTDDTAGTASSEPSIAQEIHDPSTSTTTATSSSCPHPGNRLFSRYPCPLNCGQGPWSTPRSVFKHITRSHLPGFLDRTPLEPWLLQAKRWICSPCNVLVPLKKNCKCGKGPESPPATTTVAVAVDTTPDDDTVWTSILQHALPVTRSIPLGVREQWYTALSTELERCSSDAPPEAFTRLMAFCRIALAPLGRGGKRHCRQAAAVMRQRLNRWAAGQHQALAQEYLRDALLPRQGPRETTSDDLLPESIRRAALRAVNEGALGKAVRTL